MKKLLRLSAIVLATTASQPASAVTWVRYQVSGLGDVTTYSFPYFAPPSTRSLAIAIGFSVATDASGGTVRDNVSGLNYRSDGTTFSGYLNGGTFDVAATAPGTLTYQERADTAYNRVVGDISVAFADVDNLAGFPLAIGAGGAALGTIDYLDSGKGGYIHLVGDVNAFRILGVEAAWRDTSYTAVPEPMTWAMMIGGFGLVGGNLRLRRRTTVRFA